MTRIPRSAGNCTRCNNFHKADFQHPIRECEAFRDNRDHQLGNLHLTPAIVLPPQGVDVPNWNSPAPEGDIKLRTGFSFFFLQEGKHGEFGGVMRLLNTNLFNPFPFLFFPRLFFPYLSLPFSSKCLMSEDRKCRSVALLEPIYSSSARCGALLFTSEFQWLLRLL